MTDVKKIDELKKKTKRHGFRHGEKTYGKGKRKDKRNSLEILLSEKELCFIQLKSSEPLYSDIKYMFIIFVLIWFRTTKFN